MGNSHPISQETFSLKCNLTAPQSLGKKKTKFLKLNFDVQKHINLQDNQLVSMLRMFTKNHTLAMSKENRRRC